MGRGWKKASIHKGAIKANGTIECEATESISHTNIGKENIDRTGTRIYV